MLEGKDQGHNMLTQVFSKKKVFLKLPRGLWCVFQDEEKKGHDFGPFFTNQKIVLSSTANRAFSRACRPRPKDFIIEAKDFKMCSRGRGRGLPLWKIATLFKIKLILFLPKSQQNLYYFCVSHFAIEWDVFKQYHIDHCLYNHFEVFLSNFGNDTLFH